MWLDFAKVQKDKVQAHKQKLRMLVYGEYFTGKTFFANSFPSTKFVFSTDGNTQDLKDSIIVRLAYSQKHKNMVVNGWEVFKSAINDMILNAHKFEQINTIIIDTIGDLYKMCRAYVLKRLGLTHEQDQGTGYGKAYSMISSEFANTMLNLLGNNFANKHIVLISHQINQATLGNAVELVPDQNKALKKINLQGYLNLVAKFSTQEDMKTQNTIRVLNISLNENISSGNRFGLDNINMFDPSFTKLMNYIEKQEIIKQDTSNKNQTIKKQDTKIQTQKNTNKEIKTNKGTKNG